jgi:hypothetical protein
MNRVLTILSGLILAGAIAIPAMAQVTSRETANFDQFLSNHPETAQQLASHPGLVNDPQYLASHPNLQNFLSNHPGVAGQLRTNPGRFMTDSAGHYHWGGGPGGPGWHPGGPGGYGYPPGGGYGAPPPGNYGYGHPMSNTDNYLSNHPDVAAQLERNPRLVDDPNYMSQHPGLHEFMQTHPEARAEWKAHPDKYMSHENQYEHHHPNQH